MSKLSDSLKVILKEEAETRVEDENNVDELNNKIEAGKDVVKEDAETKVEDEDNVDELNSKIEAGKDVVKEEDEFAGQVPVADGPELQIEGEEIEDPYKLNVEGYDPAEDFRAIFGEGDELSEEFKEKALSVLKAAVISNVNKLVAEQFVKQKAAFDAKLNEEVNRMTTKIESYADTIVEEWKSKNAPILEANMKNDVALSFLEGIKILFEQHNIEIPEGKEDLFQSMVTENEALEAKLNEALNRNVELAEKVNETKKELILKEEGKSLSDNQLEKFASLVESVSFKNEDDFRKEVKTLKESFFKAPKIINPVDKDEQKIVLTEQKVKSTDDEVAASMAAVAKIFRR